MTTCTQLSDRMPDVAHGTSRWTETEEHHLAACADCRAEWELVTAASRLGAALPLAGRCRPRIAGSCSSGWRASASAPGCGLGVWTVAGLAAAAAVMLAVWTGARTGPRPSEHGSPCGDRPVTRARPEAPGAPGDSAPPVTRTPALATAPPAPHAPSFRSRSSTTCRRKRSTPCSRRWMSPGARADAYELPALADPGDRELERVLTGLEG